MFKNNEGFSLIELMVVVAIIGILATVAIPSYQNFQAKARQKEGMSLLSSYYTAAHSTFADIGGFPGDFVGTGFAPAGVLKYQLNAEANTGTEPPFGSFDDGCETTADDCDAVADYKVWSHHNTGVLKPFDPDGVQAADVTDSQFIVSVGGQIKPGSQADVWAITHKKELQICQDGLLPTSAGVNGTACSALKTW